VFSPKASRRRTERDTPARAGHYHQRVAGEQLGAAHDHQDKSERKDQTGEEARNSPRKCAGPGQHHGHENRAEHDEGAGKKS
jgi:hypothetical protein